MPSAQAAATVLHDGLPAPSAAAPASALGFGTVQGSVEGTGYTWSDTFFGEHAHTRPVDR